MDLVGGPGDPLQLALGARAQQRNGGQLVQVLRLVRHGPEPRCDRSPVRSTVHRRETVTKRSVSTIPPMDVVLLRWPLEQERRERLEGEGRLRLLLVEGGVAAPPTSDCLEDWIRVPADEADVRARIDALGVRFAAHRSESPALDRDGLLRFAGGWVSLPPVEARLMAALIERYGAVVSRDQLSRFGLAQGSPGPQRPRRPRAAPAPPHRAARPVHQDGAVPGLPARGRDLHHRHRGLTGRSLLTPELFRSRDNRRRNRLFFRPGRRWGRRCRRRPRSGPGPRSGAGWRRCAGPSARTPASTCTDLASSRLRLGSRAASMRPTSRSPSSTGST